MKEQKFLLFLILLLININLNSTTYSTGVPGLMFDAIGSRSFGLQEATTIIGEKPEATFANPSLSIKQHNPELSLMYLNWIVNMNLLYLGISTPIKYLDGSIGLGINYFSSGEFDKYIPGKAEKQGLTSSENYNILINYSRYIINHLSTGINLKVIHTTIDTYNCTTFAADIGILYKITSYINYAITYQNFGKKQKFDTSSSLLPENLKTGFGVTINLNHNNNILFDIEYNHPNDSDDIIRSGIEYNYILYPKKLKIISVRSGFQLCIDGSHKMSFGVGSELPITKYLNNYILSIDYALLNNNSFGYNHSITLSIKFNKSIEQLLSDNKENKAINEEYSNNQKSETIDEQIITKENAIKKAIKVLDFDKAQKLKIELDNLKKEKIKKQELDEINLKITKKKEEINQAVKNLDFDKAIKLKNELKLLENKKNNILRK